MTLQPPPLGILIIPNYFFRINPQWNCWVKGCRAFLRFCSTHFVGFKIDSYWSRLLRFHFPAYPLRNFVLSLGDSFSCVPGDLQDSEEELVLTAVYPNGDCEDPGERGQNPVTELPLLPLSPPET